MGQVDHGAGVGFVVFGGCRLSSVFVFNSLLLDSIRFRRQYCVIVVAMEVAVAAEVVVVVVVVNGLGKGR